MVGSRHRRRGRRGPTGTATSTFRSRKHKSPAQRIKTEPTRPGPAFRRPWDAESPVQEGLGACRLPVMALDRLRHRLWGDTWGPQVTAVLLMPPCAAVAILVLRQLHLVAQTPIWLVPAILGRRTTGHHGHRDRVAPSPDAGPPAPVDRLSGHRRDRHHLRDGLGSGARHRAGPHRPGEPGGGGLVVLAGDRGMDAGVPRRRPGAGRAGLGAVADAGAGGLRAGHPDGHRHRLLLPLPPLGALIEREEAAALTDSRERRFRALVQSSSDLVFVRRTTPGVTLRQPLLHQGAGVRARRAARPRDR